MSTKIMADQLKEQQTSLNKQIQDFIACMEKDVLNAPLSVNVEGEYNVVPLFKRIRSLEIDSGWQMYCTQLVAVFEVRSDDTTGYFVYSFIHNGHTRDYSESYSCLIGSRKSQANFLTQIGKILTKSRTSLIHKELEHALQDEEGYMEDLEYHDNGLKTLQEAYNILSGKFVLDQYSLI